MCYSVWPSKIINSHINLYSACDRQSWLTRSTVVDYVTMHACIANFCFSQSVENYDGTHSSNMLQAAVLLGCQYMGWCQYAVLTASFHNTQSIVYLFPAWTCCRTGSCQCMGWYQYAEKATMTQKFMTHSKLPYKAAVSQCTGWCQYADKAVMTQLLKHSCTWHTADYSTP